MDMDNNKGNGIGNIPAKSINWTRSIDTVNKETEPVLINEAQERIIQKLEEALKFLKQVEIKNEESFDNMKKPVDDLLSSLKYLPTKTSIDILPTEIKTDILSYLCDAGAFVAASVCEEWKEILKPSLRKMDAVTIGKHCSNYFECENSKCFMPEEILKASKTLKLNIPLTVCYPLIDVDSEIIIKGLSSVSSLNFDGSCTCRDNDGDDYEYESLLTTSEVSQLFQGLEEKNEVMENLELRGVVIMNGIDQNRITDHLLNRTRRLTLFIEHDPSLLDLDVPNFVRKLLHNSEDSPLIDLTLHNFNYRNNLSIEVADALCNVFSVNLKSEFHLKKVTAKRLIRNILTWDVVMRRLTVENMYIDWRVLISPNDLKRLLNNMEVVSFMGRFTPEQVEAAKSLPGIEASLEKVSKGSF